jgi:hypothetical protein
MKFAKVAAWFFVLITSILTLVSSALTLPTIGGPGPGAPLEGVAIMICLIMLVISVIVFVLCVVFRPRRKLLTRSAVVGSILLYLGLALALRLAMSARAVKNQYSLSVRFLNEANEPVPDATVTYFTYQATDGLAVGNSLKGSSVTDSTGSFRLRSYHQHSVSLDIMHPQYQRASLNVEAAHKGIPHQITPRDMKIIPPANATAEVPPIGASIPPRYWLVPAARSIDVTAVLMSNSTTATKGTRRANQLR